MRFGLLSDVHLEFAPMRPPENGADVMLLAGDIGDPFHEHYSRFLGECSRMYKDVVLVAGNHEFYGSTIAETRTRLQDLCATWPNVHFLYNEAVTLKSGVKILGSTLWSSISEEDRHDVAWYINDFRRIRNWSPEHHNMMHRKSTEWIQEEMPADIVLTHFSPIIQDRQKGLDLVSVFSTDLRPLMANCRVWCFGHTHFSEDSSVQNTRILSNPRGYAGENRAFDANMGFTL